MSNYINIGEDQPVEWNIVPLSIYLYGVEDSRNRPVFGSFKIKHVLEERYRARYLSAYCQTEACKTSDKSEWREMVGATFVRSVYMFVVDTTLEQDLALISEFNALPNENHFNGFTRNCADFTGRVINTYFPGSTHRDYINDFGMTSPKAIAHSFTRYALRHPEARFRVLQFAQLPGTIKRSRECRSGTEQLYHSKKFLVPMLIFADQELAVTSGWYALTGRFNPAREVEKHPTPGAAEIGFQIQLAKADKDKARAKELEILENQERERVVGTSQDWKVYRTAFDSITQEAIHEEVTLDRDHLNHFFNYLDKVGTPISDGDGALWMEIQDGGETFKVGVSVNNILDAGSDSRTAYELMLARAGHVLKSPKHGRETMLDFKQDWALLESAREKSSMSVAKTTKPATGVQESIVSGDGKD